MTAFNPPDRRTQPIPVIPFNERRASHAYEAHTAMLDQERRFPKLKSNPAWIALRADAYEEFALSFAGEA